MSRRTSTICDKGKGRALLYPGPSLDALNTPYTASPRVSASVLSSVSICTDTTSHLPSLCVGVPVLTWPFLTYSGNPKPPLEPAPARPVVFGGVGAARGLHHRWIVEALHFASHTSQLAIHFPIDCARRLGTPVESPQDSVTWFCPGWRPLETPNSDITGHAAAISAAAASPTIGQSLIPSRKAC